MSSIEANLSACRRNATASSRADGERASARASLEAGLQQGLDLGQAIHPSCAVGPRWAAGLDNLRQVQGCLLRRQPGEGGVLKGAGHQPMTDVDFTLFTETTQTSPGSTRSIRRCNNCEGLYRWLPGDQPQHLQHRRHGAEGLLVAVAVHQDRLRAPGATPA